MVDVTTGWLENGGCYTAAQDRQVLRDMVCADGVRDVIGGDLLLTTGGTGLTLNVAQGGGWIIVDPTDDRGAYGFYVTDTYPLTATANASGNPRIDRVVVQLYDSQYGGLADESKPEIIAGTPTGGATLTNLTGVAAQPTDAITIAYLLVPSGFAGPFVNATHIRDARTEFTLCGNDPKGYCELDAAAVTAIPNTGVSTQVTLGTTTHNDTALFTVSANFIILNFDGIYDISARGRLANGTAGQRNIDIVQNALTTPIAMHRINPAQDTTGTPQIMGVTLVKGTAIGLAASQTGAAGNINCDLGRLMVRKVG